MSRRAVWVDRLIGAVVAVVFGAVYLYACQSDDTATGPTNPEPGASFDAHAEP